MARKKQPSNDFAAQFLADEVERITDHVAKALAVIQQAGIETKPLVPFPLDKTERATVASLTALSPQLRKKLVGKSGKFTVAAALDMVIAVADSVLAAEPGTRDTLSLAARKLMYGVHMDVLLPLWRAQARKTKPTRLLYQLKITLIGVKPTIWRRIQVKDCTLDKLHEHIQTAMGWTNSHLNQFDVDGQRYSDPELMEENFAEMNYRDSTVTLLSSLLPKDGKPSRFRYVYDFGDGWTHDVLFEGCPKPERGQKYPVCLEGERACPPEDVGGVWGYTEFLKTIKGRKRRKRVETLEWAAGWFDPGEFDAATATKSMWKGLPDWRNME
jgi:hypothetical protein